MYTLANFVKIKNMKNNLSVFLITKQEGKNLDKCLASVPNIADEIIIVDSGSTDNTLEIAKKYGAKIFHKDFVSFTEQKNFALSKCSCTWALNLDGDEYLTPALASEIKRTLDKTTDFDGYFLIRNNIFLGRKMKHSGIARESRLRLVKTKKAKYVGGLVHEELIVEGKTSTLKNTFMHNTYTSIEQYFEKFNRYSTLAAMTMQQKHKKFNIFHLLRAPFEFIKIYFFRLGFLDGLQGFLWALFNAWYKVVKYTKLWDLTRKEPK